jgi:sugar-phosphatase
MSAVFECRAILFDLDGVLVDSSVVLERHWKEWADRHGVSFERLATIMHGRTPTETIRMMAPHVDAEEEGRVYEVEEGADTDGVEAYPAACGLLRSLPSHGWAVVTSGRRATAFARLGCGGFPDPPVLVCGEDVHRGKPDPEPYLLAAKRLDVSPEQCLVVEDSPAGIDSARSAGMRVVAVATTHDAQALALADVVTREIGDLRVQSEAGGFAVEAEDSG